MKVMIFKILTYSVLCAEKVTKYFIILIIFVIAVRNNEFIPCPFNKKVNKEKRFIKFKKIYN